MWSQTRRALRADVRTYFAWARTVTSSPGARFRVCRAGAGAGSAGSSAAARRPRRPRAGAGAASSASSAAAGSSTASSTSSASSTGSAATGSPLPSCSAACAASLPTPVSSAAVPSACGVAPDALRRRRGFGVASACAASSTAAASSESAAAASASAWSTLPLSGSPGTRGLISADLPGARVTAVRSRRGELAELVADHRLAHEHGHMLAPVVHGDGVAHHLGEDRRRPGPGPDHLLLIARVHGLDARHEALLDPRALLARTAHAGLPALLAAATAADDVAI